MIPRPIASNRSAKARPSPVSSTYTNGAAWPNQIAGADAFEPGLFFIAVVVCCRVRERRSAFTLGQTARRDTFTIHLSELPEAHL